MSFTYNKNVIEKFIKKAYEFKNTTDFFNKLTKEYLINSITTRFIELKIIMKDFIKYVIGRKANLQMEDVVSFITYYCDLMKVKLEGNQINMIVQLLQSGHFDLMYACKIAAKKIDIVFTELYDKNGNFISVSFS